MREQTFPPEMIWGSFEICALCATAMNRASGYDLTLEQSMVSFLLLACVWTCGAKMTG